MLDGLERYSTLTEKLLERFWKEQNFKNIKLMVEYNSMKNCIFFILFRSKSSTFPSKKGKKYQEKTSRSSIAFSSRHIISRRVYTRTEEEEERNGTQIVLRLRHVRVVVVVVGVSLFEARKCFAAKKAIVVSKNEGNSSIQSAIGIGHHLCRKQLRRRRGEPHAHEERHIPRVRWMCRAGNAGDAGTRLRAAVRARRRKQWRGG